MTFYRHKTPRGTLLTAAIVAATLLLSFPTPAWANRFAEWAIGISLLVIAAPATVVNKPNIAIETKRFFTNLFSLQLCRDLCFPVCTSGESQQGKKTKKLAWQSRSRSGTVKPSATT
jgi:hypothetical protein